MPLELPLFNAARLGGGKLLFMKILVCDLRGIVLESSLAGV